MKHLRWAGLLLMAAAAAVSLTSCEWLFEVGTATSTASSGVFSSINTGGTNVYPLSFPKAGTIREIENVTIRGLNHAEIGDLTIRLVHPGTSSVLLHSSARTNGSGYAFVGDYQFVDSGDSDGNPTYTPSGGGGSPIVSTVPYQAIGDLDTLDDRDTIGTWQLQIDALTSGNIVSWQITIRYDPI